MDTGSPDHELSGRRGELDSRERVAGSCRYCGSPLHHSFYFCLACGTPFRDITSIVMPATPPVLGEGEKIRLVAPGVATVFWTYFSVVVGSAVLSYLLFTEDRPNLAFLFTEVAMFITTCVIGFIYRQTLRAQLKRFGFFRAEAWIGLAVLVPVLGINYLYHGWVQEMAPDGEMLNLDELRAAGMGELFLVMSFCVYPAIAEELAFRGLIQHWLAVAIKPWRALVLASVLFAVMHFSVISFPYLFGVGMLLGWVKWRTGSLYPSMLIHFLHNLIVIEAIEPMWY